MNTWMIVAIVAGLLVLGGVVLLGTSKPVQADALDGSCPLGYGASEGCPYQGTGGCTQESNCGLDTCAAKYGGSCGCGGAR